MENRIGGLRLRRAPSGVKKMLIVTSACRATVAQKTGRQRLGDGNRPACQHDAAVDGETRMRGVCRQLLSGLSRYRMMTGRTRAFVTQTVRQACSFFVIEKNDSGRAVLPTRTGRPRVGTCPQPMNGRSEFR